MKRKIASHYALIDGRLERNIVIEVTERTITAIEHVENIDSCAGVEFYPGILISGMVNTHCHLNYNTTPAAKRLMWEEGIESSADNSNLPTCSSMVDAMRSFDDKPLEELLLWATRHGAETLGLEDRLGNLKIGTSPGIVIIENANLHNMRLTAETISRRII